jgi:glycosyltransferase involved in cell wall biosynthesis
MKILHLFSNYKWTGPAEPAAQLARGLRDRGHKIEFAVGGKSTDSAIYERASALGLRTTIDLNLSKHGKFFANRADIRDLAAKLIEEEFDIIHCHQDNDHRIAAAALKQVGHATPLVRHIYQVEGFNANRRTRPMVNRTQAVFTIADIATAAFAKEFGYPTERIHRIEVPIDMERFDPSRNVPDMRKALGIPQDAFLIGIVARVQRRRRFDLFLGAVEKIIAEHDNVHAIIVGRGTHIDKLAIQPVKEMGLEGRVHFPNYRGGDEYIGLLKAIDVKAYLVPGTDGSCRAVREALAMGIPVVATHRGILPELINNDHLGTLVKETQVAIKDGLLRYVEHPVREKSKIAASVTARDRFNLATAVDTVENVYKGLV